MIEWKSPLRQMVPLQGSRVRSCSEPEKSAANLEDEEEGLLYNSNDGSRSSRFARSDMPVWLLLTKMSLPP
jgi:hypothetical protein